MSHAWYCELKLSLTFQLSFQCTAASHTEFAVPVNDNRKKCQLLKKGIYINRSTVIDMYNVPDYHLHTWVICLCTHVY